MVAPNTSNGIITSGIPATETYSSTNWTFTSAPGSGSGPTAVASSYDGTKLVLAVNSGNIYTSVNGGTSFTTTSVPVEPWIALAGARSSQGRYQLY